VLVGIKKIKKMKLKLKQKTTRRKKSEEQFAFNPIEFSYGH